MLTKRPTLPAFKSIRTGNVLLLEDFQCIAREVWSLLFRVSILLDVFTKQILIKEFGKKYFKNGKFMTALPMH